MNSQSNKSAEEIFNDLESGKLAPLSQEIYDRFEGMAEDEELNLKGEDFELLKIYYAQKRLEVKQRIKRQNEEIKPFFNDLKEIGDKSGETHNTQDILINQKSVNIILDHLKKDYSKNVKRMMIQALDNRMAKGMVAEELLIMFKSFDDELKYELGHVLESVATEHDLPKILKFFNDEKISDAGKTTLPSVLSRLMGKQAIPILIKAADERKSKTENNLFVMNCIESLGKLKAHDALNLAEYYTKHNDSWYRSESKKAVRKINSIKQVGKITPKDFKLLKDNAFDYKYEISTEIEVEKIEGFFKKLSEEIGIGLSEFGEIILDIEVEETRTYEFTINKLMRTKKLFIQIHMDDINVPALFFFSSSKKLIKSISKIIEEYIED